MGGQRLIGNEYVYHKSCIKKILHEPCINLAPMAVLASSPIKLNFEPWVSNKAEVKGEFL